MSDRTGYDLVLASASQRRYQLLRAAGYRFIVELSDFDEDVVSKNIEAGQYARQLALGKAMSVAKKRPGDIVLGADTICQCDGEIIGKPLDSRDAERITRKLFSKPHKTITGIAIVRLSDNTKIVTHDVTTVYPRKMTEQQIASHLAGGSWEGKAGAYAIQETGDQFVERLDGSLSNVVGLPMELLEKVLRPLLKKSPQINTDSHRQAGPAAYGSIVILEDNGERCIAMQREISQRIPLAACEIFHNAPDMTAWLKEEHKDIILMSLDHDLEPSVNDTRKMSDPGTGRDVADYLISQKPTCPIVIHTTNQFAGDAMQFALQDIGWKVRRVVPYDDLTWIRKGWIETVIDLIQTNKKSTR